MNRTKPDERLVALLKETFPDCPHNMLAVAEALEYRVRRGPQHPPILDQLVAIEQLERSLRVAIASYQRLEGARHLFIDMRTGVLGDAGNRIVDFDVGLKILHNATEKVLLQERERGQRRLRGKVDWYSVNAMWEICICWRDREMSVPVEKRRRIPRAISADRSDGEFGPFVEKVFEFLELKGRPVSALRAVQRVYPEFSEQWIGVPFTDKPNKEAD